MRRLHLLFVVVALLLLAALGFWLVRDPSSAAAGGGAVLAGATSRDAARREAMATRDAAALAPSGLAVDARSDDTAPAEAASATPAAAPDDGSVAARFLGRVVDETGVPIAGATVVYWPNEYTLPLYGLTQWASGTALEALPRAVTDGGGRFALEARHRNGVSSWSSLPDPELVVIAGEYATRTRRCEAYGGGERDVGDIALEPGARLTGRIVDETGLPIAGAAIGLWNPGGHSLRGTADRTIDWYFAARSATFGGARSGADGRFRTGPLWDGTVQIGVQAEGFIDVWIDRVAVKVGADNDRGDIVLARGAAISGIVRDAQEAPVAGARLIAWEPYDVQRGRDDPAQERDTILRELSSKSGDSEASTGERTGADGRFAVPGLPATNHRLIVDADGYEPLLVENLLPGGAALILTLTRAAALRLVVRDAVARQPVAGAVVHARRLSGDEHDEQGEELPVRAGDAAGTFLVERLGRVRTVLSVSAPGFAATTLALDGIVAPGRLERTLELLPEARVTGRITDVSGAPIAKAIVLAAPHRAARSADEAGGAGNANATDKPGDSGDGGARPSPELEAQSATTDVQGSYALAGLAAGEWTLVADAEDFAHVERTVTTSEGAPLPDTDFVLPAAASLHGTCFASDGTPKAGSVEEFQWVDPDGRGDVEPDRTVRSDEHGRYEVRDLQPGTWRLSSRDEIVVTVAVGERRELDLRDAQKPGVSGRILHADGTPAAGAWVAGKCRFPGGDPENAFPVMVPADAAGHFERELWPGHYALVGVMPAPANGMSALTEFDLAAGEQRQLEFVLGELQLRGRVVEASDGTPVAAAVASALPVMRTGQPAAFSSVGVGGVAVNLTVVTGADGRFAIAGLAPGLYAVSATVHGARVAPVQLALAPGPVPEAELLTTRLGTIRGTVHDAAGVPPPNGAILIAEGPAPDDAGAVVQDGQFVLDNLDAGSWTLRVRLDSRVVAEQNVALAAGQKIDVEIILP